VTRKETAVPLKDVTTDNFTREVLRSDVPVVVDFHADWCGPCHVVSPILEQLSEEWGDAVKVVKVDIEMEPELATAYRISSIPAVLLFRSGKVDAWSLGAKPGYLIEKDLGLKNLSRSDGDVQSRGLISSLKAWLRA
jgi:thioredoxin 1